jgi:hypothetical protein
VRTNALGSPIHAEGARRAHDSEDLSGRTFDVSPVDGRFLLLKPQTGLDRGPTHATVILNWFEELRTRARR